MILCVQLVVMLCTGSTDELAEGELQSSLLLLDTP